MAGGQLGPCSVCRSHSVLLTLRRPITYPFSDAAKQLASTVLDRVVVIEGRYGVMLGQDPSEAAADLERALSAFWTEDEFLSQYPLRCEVTGARFGSAQIPPDHPLPRGLAAASERVTGHEPAAIGVPYGADMRLFVNEGDTPCVMYGPGDVRHAHAADERVPIKEVVTYTRVLAEWVTQELSAPAEPA